MSPAFRTSRRRRNRRCRWSRIRPSSRGLRAARRCPAGPGARCKDGSMAKPRPSERRVAFVTGASQGIGAAIAVALAREGFDLVVSSTRPEKLKSVLNELAAAGAKAVPVALDVRAQPGIEKAMADAVAAFGHIDVLVNNAAVRSEEH